MGATRTTERAACLLETLIVESAEILRETACLVFHRGTELGFRKAAANPHFAAVDDSASINYIVGIHVNVPRDATILVKVVADASARFIFHGFQYLLRRKGVCRFSSIACG